MRKIVAANGKLFHHQPLHSAKGLAQGSPNTIATSWLLLLDRFRKTFLCIITWPIDTDQ